MNKYLVSIKEIEKYEVEVEAESEAEAERQAWDILSAVGNKSAYYIDSDGEVEFIEEIEE